MIDKTAKPVTAEEANRQGILHCKAGAMAEGAECFRQAICLSPDAFQYQLNLGNALNAMEKWAAAEKVLRVAFSLAPTNADIHKAIATAFMGLGRSEKLLLLYQNALVERPNDTALARNFCVVLLQLRQIQQATKLARELRSAAPQDVETAVLLASCLENAGQLVEAAQMLLDVLALAPRHVTAAFRLGVIQAGRGNYGGAATTFETVLRIAPNHLEATRLLGVMRLHMGQVSEAILLLRRVISTEPNSPEASRSLGMAYAYRGSLEAAVDNYRASLALTAGQRDVRSNYVYTLSLMRSASRAEIFEAHREWGLLHDQFAPFTFENTREPERRLKIGYLSPDFREHSISYFIEPLLIAHDRKAFDVFCYADGLQFDATSLRLKSATDNWRAIGTCDDSEAMQLIRRDGIDILVDLAGHTGSNRLSIFSRRSAPLQITWLGYPETTGIPAMDYKITDAVVSPPSEGDRFFTETLLRLPNGFHCYRPPPNCPLVAMPPHLRNGHVTFGSFADLPKVNPDVVAAWATVLRAVPGARLVMKCRQFADEAVRDKYQMMFETAGIAVEKIALMERSPTTAEHLALYSEIDVVLDTFPYNGTTTICEALWMGVPVVTMFGERPASRVGASLMREIGLTDMIANNVDEFVQIATALARSNNRLTNLRRTMRERLNSSALRDEAGFAQAIEAAYRAAWRRWCTCQTV